MEEKELSKTTGLKFISIQLLKLAANSNYIGAIINAFCDGLNTLQINNIIEVVNDLKERVEYIEEKTKIKLHFDNPVFVDDILPTLQKAKDELNEQKRKLYVTFITACIHPDNLDCNNKKIYANYLDQLDYLSIYILNSLDHYCSEKHLIEKIDVDYDKDTILVHLLALNSMGLIDKIGAEEFERLHKRFGNIKILHPENVFFYKRNHLGNGLLSFILKGNPQ